MLDTAIVAPGDIDHLLRFCRGTYSPGGTLPGQYALPFSLPSLSLCLFVSVCMCVSLCVSVCVSLSLSLCVRFSVHTSAGAGITDACADKVDPLNGGVHANLYNNLWGTAFPQWYDDDGVARFQVHMAAA